MDYITDIVITFYIFFIVFWFMRQQKIFTNMSNILRDMIKMLDFEPKKPKTLKEFWKNFTDISKLLNDNQIELDKKIRNVKRYNWIPITCTIIMVFLTAYSVNLHQIEVDLSTTEDLISDVTGIEKLKRMGDNELYMLYLHNYGSLEHNLQVTITFPWTTTILGSQNIDEEKQIVNETIRKSDTEYYVLYSKIHANDDITIRLDISNDDLKENSSLLIYPKSVRAYTDEGKVVIVRDID